MRIFARLRRRSDARAARNRVEELADRLAGEGRAAEVESALDALDRVGLGSREIESWHHLRGVAVFQRGDRPEALRRFEEAYRLFPDSAPIAFSLGQEHEHLGNVDRMIELFDRSRFPRVPAKFALAQARYAYLWGRIAEALGYIRPIADTYLQLRCADETFLHIRRLPFVSETWGALLCLHQLDGRIADFVELTRKLRKRIADYDFTLEESLLEGVVSGDFSRCRSRLKALATERAAAGVSGGYYLMLDAMLEARQEPDRKRAAASVAAVPLEPRDYPWLEDIRTVGLASIAARHGDEPAEAELRARFLARQPLLFEPTHAGWFQLVEYQERLKPAYQAARRRQ